MGKQNMYECFINFWACSLRLSRTQTHAHSGMHVCTHTHPRDLRSALYSSQQSEDRHGRQLLSHTGNKCAFSGRSWRGFNHLLGPLEPSRQPAGTWREFDTNGGWRPCWPWAEESKHGIYGKDTHATFKLTLLTLQLVAPHLQKHISASGKVLF